MGAREVLDDPGMLVMITRVLGWGEPWLETRAQVQASELLVSRRYA